MARFRMGSTLRQIPRVNPGCKLFHLPQKAMLLQHWFKEGVPPPHRSCPDLVREGLRRRPPCGISFVLTCQDDYILFCWAATCKCT